jgi:membrane-associated protein
MTVLASVSTYLEHFRGPVVYVLVGALVFGEASVLLGFVIPGETAALAGGALASLRHANLALVAVVVVGCAIAGDSTGYEVGKVLGPWLIRHRPLRGHAGVMKAEQLIAAHGGPAVFLGRWIALARALVPGISGMSGMRYRTFLLFNVIGGITWGVTFVMVGYATGTAYGAVAGRIGIYAGAVVAAAVVGVVVWALVRRRRERRSVSTGQARR